MFIVESSVKTFNLIDFQNAYWVFALSAGLNLSLIN